MSKKVSIRVPATSANCGPGFDSLGLALNMYNYFTYELLPEGLELQVEGQGGAHLKADAKNLAFSSFMNLWQAYGEAETGLRITMKNNIPFSRGLGSSSTAIVAGLVAADHFLGTNLPKQELINRGTALEGHPDNIAPAFVGGFTINCMEDGKTATFRFIPPHTLSFVAVVPSKPLPTVLARKAIPVSIPHVDAVFNTGRAALLTAALMSGSYEYLSTALQDRLHQPYRAHLLPGMQDAFAAAKSNGAYNAVLSGAGSTLLAYLPDCADWQAVGKAMQSALQASGMKSYYKRLELDAQGAIII